MTSSPDTGALVSVEVNERKALGGSLDALFGGCRVLLTAGRVQCGQPQQQLILNETHKLLLNLLLFFFFLNPEASAPYLKKHSETCSSFGVVAGLE